MRHSYKFIVFLVMVLVCSSSIWAYEFDLDQWNKDARNLKRMERLSENMRIRFADFAKEHGLATRITGEQHALADQTIESYARIRHHVGLIAERWEDAVPSRPTMNDNKEARVKGTALTLAANAVLLKKRLCPY